MGLAQRSTIFKIPKTKTKEILSSVTPQLSISNMLLHNLYIHIYIYVCIYKEYVEKSVISDIRRKKNLYYVSQIKTFANKRKFLINETQGFQSRKNIPK